MASFHISSNGVAKICKAQPGRCPLTEDDGKPMSHFETADEAFEYVKQKEEKNYGLSNSLQKDSENTDEIGISGLKVSEEKKILEEKPLEKDGVLLDACLDFDILTSLKEGDSH